MVLRDQMRLTFNRKTRSFLEPDDPDAAEASDVFPLLSGSMQRDFRNQNDARIRGGFNDLTHYVSLRSRENVSKVEISEIAVHNNSFVMGVQVHYRVHYNDGDVKFGKVCPQHFYRSGYYAYRGASETSSFTLANDEYLAEVRTREGDITDRITFITNKRTFSFGGTGGDEDANNSRPPDLTRRVVAFIGTSFGVLHRLGAISINRNWEVVGDLILLRKLVEKKRASVIHPMNYTMQKLFTNASEDIFRHVVSFLVVHRPVEET